MLTPGNCSTIGGQIGGIHGQKNQYAAAIGLGALVAPPIDRIGAAFDAAAALVERVNRFANRVAGPAPTEGANCDGVAKLPPGAVIPALVDRAETTISGISDANAALARLESLFWL